MQNKNFQPEYLDKKQQEKNRKIEKLFGSTKIIKKPIITPVIQEKSRSNLNVIYQWEAREFEKINRHPKWYLYFYIILFAICIYALFVNNLLLAILIILFGLIFYLLEKREPKNYSFGITKEGVFAQDSLYPFSSIEDFWIFYTPKGIKELSLKNKKHIIPYTQIPIGQANPSRIREILINFIPEKKHEQTIFDYIERFF